MRILVLSDSHHCKIDIALNKYDYIIHCGDYGSSIKLLKDSNVIFVKGNCDFNGDKEKTLEINNKKIYVTHGDMYNVKMSYNTIVYKAMSMDANICLFGHTHRPDMFVIDDILYLNPGAYIDGFYAVIDDNYVTLYFNDKVYKKYDFKW